jgi:hypothetical protein
MKRETAYSQVIKLTDSEIKLFRDSYDEYELTIVTFNIIIRWAISFLN